MGNLPPKPPTTKIPSFAVEEDHAEQTTQSSFRRPPAERRPYLIHVAGPNAGDSLQISSEPVRIGRAAGCTFQIEDEGVSRQHACVRASGRGTFVVEDLGSANGTFLNGRRVDGAVELRTGDKIELSPNTVLKFALYDELDEKYEERLRQIRDERKRSIPPPARPWTPDGFRERKVEQAVEYGYKPEALERALEKLRGLPPLVTSWEVEELKRLIAEAQEGRQFLLQGGDCAETHADCDPQIITNKLKILLQMSLVLIRGAGRPVIRVGRFAGQYAKPRSNPTEVRDGVELPSYFGDLVNRVDFTAEARRPDPELLVLGYFHAAATLNFIRALSTGGFADLRKPEHFDLTYFERADLPLNVRTDYQRMCREMTEGLQFMRVIGDRVVDELVKVTFYTSHEGLNLFYEASQTRRRPRREGFYDLTTHLPWIGERTRRLDGAHVEFFRGVANPIAVKLGPTATAEDAIALCDTLNPANEAGKMVLVTRFGVKNVRTKLPGLVSGVRDAGRKVLWVSDPMHGNIITTRSGAKTRDFDDILSELELALDVHNACGTYLGGVHFELTGEDVTECIGGGLAEADLDRNDSTLCDPRLNYRQAIQMAFALAKPLAQIPRPPSVAPP